jgi:CheY-like chemotaxis protein
MGDLKGKLALVVDDESETRDFLSAILDDSQMKIMTAGNGIEAMQKVREAKPDVITLDLMMPGQSGMKFFNELKSQDEYKSIPVVIVSGASKVTGVDMKAFIYDQEFAERKKKVLGIEAKPDAFIEKPVDPETLIEAIKKTLW